MSTDPTQQELGLRETGPVKRVEDYEFEPIRGYPMLNGPASALLPPRNTILLSIRKRMDLRWMAGATRFTGAIISRS